MGVGADEVAVPLIGYGSMCIDVEGHTAVVGVFAQRFEFGVFDKIYLTLDVFITNVFVADVFVAPIPTIVKIGVFHVPGQL